MKAITENLKKAIAEYLEAKGLSATAFAEQMGWAKSTVTRWLSGYVERISDDMWDAISPLVQPYLSAVEMREVASTLANQGGFPYTLVKASEMIEVPVVGEAAAAGFEPLLESLDEWLVGASDQTEQWLATDIKPGYFCLRVAGDSMSPEYPAGTSLLVAGNELPQRGDVVVARLCEEGLVVKEYSRRDGVIDLTAINPDGRSFRIDVRNEPGRLLWMWPVIQAKINLRARRAEQDRRG